MHRQVDAIQLHRQVDAIQMDTHNICLYKEVDKNYTACNLKTAELLDYALIGACAVIRSAAGKGRGGVFLFLLFLYVIHFYFSLVPSLSSPLLSLLSLFSLSLGDDTKRPTRVDMSFNPNTINQSPGLNLFTITPVFAMKQKVPV